MNNVDLKYENVRFNTFNLWPINALVKSEILAKAGFYYSGREKEVICFSCNGKICTWNYNDDPFMKHYWTFPYCEFVQNNILLFQNVNLNPRMSIHRLPIPRFGIETTNSGIDICGKYERRFMPNSQPEKGYMANIRHSNFQSDVCDSEYCCIRDSPPIHLTQVSLKERLKTFVFWKDEFPVKAENLANAGFFYTGIDDRVKCFYCDGELNSWEKGDDPWFEHIRFFQNCPFVKINKSMNFKYQDEPETQMILSPLDKQIRDEFHDNPIIQAFVRVNNHPLHVFYEALKYQIGKQGLRTEKPKRIINNMDELCEIIHYINIKLKNSEKSLSVIDTDLKNEGGDRFVCKICLDKEISIVFLPCGHLISCTDCALVIKKCPLCRAPIRSRVKTFLS